MGLVVIMVVIASWILWRYGEVMTMDFVASTVNQVVRQRFGAWQ